MVEFFPTQAELLRFGQFSIRWYGLFYVLAFGGVWWLGRKLQKHRNLQLTHDDWLLILTSGVVGVLIGGRLGYVVLYEPGYFATHPVEIFQLWRGGMAFHGGLVGVGLALVWVVRQLRLSFWALVDVLVVPVSLGLALGRIGNWLNGELFIGNWALGVAGALIVLGVVCWQVLRRSPLVSLPTAVFLIGYSLQRIIFEQWRIDGWEGWWGLTRGQILTVVVFAMGLWILKRCLVTGLPGQARE